MEYFSTKSFWLKKSHWQLRRGVMKSSYVVGSSGVYPGGAAGEVLLHLPGIRCAARLFPESKLESEERNEQQSLQNP